MQTAPLATAAEIVDALHGPANALARIDRPSWLEMVANGNAPEPEDDADLETITATMDLATVGSPAGPEATIRELLQALHARHGDDDITTSILAALELYHLPNLIECVAEEARTAPRAPAAQPGQ